LCSVFFFDTTTHHHITSTAEWDQGRWTFFLLFFDKEHTAPAHLLSYTYCRLASLSHSKKIPKKRNILRNKTNTKQRKIPTKNWIVKMHAKKTKPKKYQNLQYYFFLNMKRNKKKGQIISFSNHMIPYSKYSRIKKNEHHDLKQSQQLFSSHMTLQIGQLSPFLWFYFRIIN